MGSNVVLHPTFLHPDTLLEAVQMLADYGQRAYVIGGPESPPPGGMRPDVFIDVSGLADMTGIHQFGGKVIVGTNMPHGMIAHASLLRTHSACLVEACEGTEEPSLLLYDFRPGADFPPTLPALAALDAEIESVWLDGNSSVGRSWSPVDEVWNPTFAWENRLPLAVRFSVGDETSGNALIFAPPPPGTTALLLAAAVRLTLEPSKTVVADAKVVLAPKQEAPFTSPGAAALLRNHLPDSDQIERAAHVALLDARAQLSPPSPETAYLIDLAAHLTRQALDRALARALRQPQPGRF